MQADIVQLIAEKIDNPSTFRNFACVSHRFSQVCKQMMPHKKTQYAKKVIKADFLGCPCCGMDAELWHELPNGVRHGVYKYHFPGDDFIIVKIYSDGEKVSEYLENIPEEYADDIYYSF